MKNIHGQAGTRQPEPGQMGAWAPYYDGLMKVITLGRERALREMTVEMAGVQAGHWVLEVGSGTGSLTLAAQAKSGPTGHVYGVDAAPQMVEAASRKAARAGAPITFQVAWIDDLPFQDGQFDRVLCSFMIFHMSGEVRRRGLAEIKRVLKPGGMVFMIDSAPSKGMLHHALTGLMGERIVEHDLAELVPALTQAGFAGVETGPTRWSMLAFIRGKA